MIVADTNVVCEVMRADPDPHVLRWMESIAPGGIGITAVTVEEIERGIGRLAPAGDVATWIVAGVPSSTATARTCSPTAPPKLCRQRTCSWGAREPVVPCILLTR